MPLLALPALTRGTLSRIDQPSLPATDHLLLRPWRDNDAAIVRDAFTCPNIQQWHVRSIDEVSEARAWIANCDAMWQQETGASWAVVTSDEDCPLGQVGLRKVSLFEAQAAISYWTVPAVRGRGIAVAATTAVAEWAMHTVGFHRLSLTHSTQNSASCRVAEKAGFEVEGTLRGWGLHADGFHDGHLHARLRSYS